MQWMEASKMSSLVQEQRLGKEIRNVKRSIKKSKLTLLHCVSAYPASENNINLPKILELKKINKSVGYSGHLHGNNDAIAALNYDIEIIEKHFTINNNLPGRDNKFALLPSRNEIFSRL